LLGAACTPSPVPIEQQNDNSLRLGTSCQSTGDCASKELVCENSICVAAPPGGQACSYYVNGVQQNWRCENDQWCGTQSGDCRDVPFCSTNTDCTSNQVCVNGYCGPSQQNNPSSTSCANIECLPGKLCSNGVCLPAEQVLPKDPVTGELLCNSDAQCWNGKVCIEEHCIITTGSVCNVDEDCGDVRTWVCQNGGCITPPPAKKPTTGGQACSYYVDGVQQNWRCDENQWCGTQSGDCRNVPFCSVNSDCTSGEVCLNGYCGPVQQATQNSPCSSNGQCISGKLCSNGQCVPAEQVLPKDPVTGEILCSRDDQCWGGKVCLDQHCVVPSTTGATGSSCTSDSQCGAGVACFQGRCTSVPSTCNYHPECLSDDFVCSNHTCVWPGPSGHTCSNANGDRWHCLNAQACGSKVNECIPADSIPAVDAYCTKDVDCGIGNKCNGFTCYKVVTNPSSCTTDAQCVEKMSFCQNNVCVFAPGGNAD